jgi:kynurenine 3-monooxygenase
MQKNKITILGAGLVGSLLAVLFRKRNYEVAVYERRPDMRKATGYAGRSINLAMSTRGWQALEYAGLKTELEKIAIPMYGRQIHNLDGTQAYQAYGKESQAIYSVSRGELNKCLMTEAEKLGAQFYFEHRCEHVDLEKNELLFDINGTSLKINAEIILGSDGAFSSLRKSYTALDRADYQQFYIEHGYKELTINAAPNNTFAIEKEALHIWPRNNFMMIALPNIDGSFTCTLFFPFEGNPAFESVKTDPEIKAFFEKYFGDALAMMPDYLEDYKNNPTASLVTVKTFPWVYKNKSCIIGDAAHAIVPFYGQGMNAGFEDCVTLINILDADAENNWEAIFKTYQAKRKPNGDAVAQLALNNFIEMRDLVADPVFLERKKIEKEITTRYPNQFKSVYEMVSFSHTPYAVALSTIEAQNKLYKNIIAQGNFFENINKADFEKTLDQLLDNYTEDVKSILPHG